MHHLRQFLCVVPLLLGSFQLNAQTEEQNIWTAAAEGDIKLLRAEIAKGVDVNLEVPGVGITPLVAAIIGNQPKAVRTLIRAGADANKASQDGNTPLHVAAFLGYDKVASELVKGGGDIFGSNFEGQSPYDTLELDWPTTEYIAGFLNLEVVEAEVMSGREAINKIFEKEAVKRARKDPWIALFIGDERAMKRHVRKMDDLNVLHDELGATPLSIASLFGYTSIAELLLKAGANPNTRNQNQSTALHGAALMGNADIVKLLLDHDADTSIVGEGNTTALDLANLDWMTTEAVAGALSVPFDFDSVTAGKKAVIELLTDSD